MIPKPETILQLTCKGSFATGSSAVNARGTSLLGCIQRRYRDDAVPEQRDHRGPNDEARHATLGCTGAPVLLHRKQPN